MVPNEPKSKQSQIYEETPRGVYLPIVLSV